MAELRSLDQIDRESFAPGLVPCLATLARSSLSAERSNIRGTATPLAQLRLGDG